MTNKMNPKHKIFNPPEFGPTTFFNLYKSFDNPG